MKNRISSILYTLILFSSFTYSQETYYSLEVGGIYSPGILDEKELDIRPSFSFATNLEYLDNDLLLSIGVKYSNMRFRQNYNYNSGPSLSPYSINGKSDYSFHSISLPVVAGYNFLNFTFPKLIVGFEMGLIFDGYEQEDYSFYSCPLCLSINQNNSMNSILVVKNNELKIIKDSQGFLNFFTGLVYDNKILGQNISSKLLFYLYTENISTDSWPYSNHTIDFKKIELILGFKF